MGAVFDEENALPDAEVHLAIDDGQGEGSISEHGFDMAGHIIGSFHVVSVVSLARGEGIKGVGEVKPHGGVGIFLYGERGGGVFDQEGDGAHVGFDGGEPSGDVLGDEGEGMGLGFKREKVSVLKKGRAHRKGGSKVG